MQRIKRLRVFAGPNGSGKSTVHQDVKSTLVKSLLLTLMKLNHKSLSIN